MAIASAVLGFVIKVPAVMLLPSAYALLGLAASEAVTLVCSVWAFRERVLVHNEPVPEAVGLSKPFRA